MESFTMLNAPTEVYSAPLYVIAPIYPHLFLCYPLLIKFCWLWRVRLICFCQLWQTTSQFTSSAPWFVWAAYMFALWLCKLCDHLLVLIVCSDWNLLLIGRGASEGWIGILNSYLAVIHDQFFNFLSLNIFLHGKHLVLATGCLIIIYFLHFLC